MNRKLMILFATIIVTFILGIILLAVGCEGFSKKANIKTGSVSKTFELEEKIKSIDIESNFLEFHIKNSESATNITISIEDFASENDIEYKVEHQILYIKALKNNAYLTISKNITAETHANMSRVIIIIPSNINFENFVFNSRASKVKGEYIKSQNVKVSNEASDFNFNNLVSDNILIISKMGNTIFNNIETKTLDIQNDAGRIEIEGLSNGNVSINNNVGEVILKLKDINEYDYKIENKVGTVTFANDSSAGLNTKTEKNTQKEKSINIKNNVGSVQVK